MVQPLYNGNISQTFWRTANDNKLRGYAYSYDALNRLDTAYYRKGTTYSNNFNETLSYDKNGNILSLQRWGVPEDYGTVPAIPNMDDLTYTYFPNSNKLRKVSDGVASTKGFNDGVNLSTEYIYDPNANVKEDKNKGITEIKYNHLNLPTEIKFSNHQKIAYIYNALGTKIEKTVTNGSNITKTEYLDSFQYIDGELQFFPVSEGYVRKTEGNRRQQYFDYVYNYTDHLGNIRLSYTTDPQSPSNIKILEESNYYPFGLQHGSYNTPARDYRPIGDAREIETVDRNPYKYKYNSKEWQDELGLDWYDYGARNYDASLGRWMNGDPLAEKYPSISTYAYVANNPIIFIDPDGRRIVVAQEADRELFMSYLNEIWGEGNFTFNSDNVLEFTGNTKGLSRKQKKALKTFRKAVDADYDINVKLSNFSDEEAEMLSPKENVLASEGGGLSLISLDNEGNVLGANVLVDPSKVTDIPLFEKGYVYLDDNNQPVVGASSCPPGKNCGVSHSAVLNSNGKASTAQKSASATVMHEIAHPLYEGKNQEDVLKFENLIRNILGIDQRSASDPEHNYNTE